MSIKAMTWVWEHSAMDGPRLLLLLALADYANDEGTHCYPSIKTLARRCRRSDRRTQALLRELEAMGEIDIELGAGPRVRTAQPTAMSCAVTGTPWG